MEDKRLKSALEGIAKGLVENPDQVQVNFNPLRSKNSVEILFQVHPDDVKMIIGRGAKTIEAIRVLVYAILAKTKTRAYIEVEGLDSCPKLSDRPS